MTKNTSTKIPFITIDSLEGHRRTLVKTILYRIVMVLITILVAFFFTGNTGDAVNIGIAANLIKTGTYYGYERLWTHVIWGR